MSHPETSESLAAGQPPPTLPATEESPRRHPRDGLEGTAPAGREHAAEPTLAGPAHTTRRGDREQGDPQALEAMNPMRGTAGIDGPSPLPGLGAPSGAPGRSTFASPAFIVGVMRSGTTLLSATLNRHPLVCVTPETDFLYKLSRYPGGSEGFRRDWPDSLYRIVDRMKPTAEWDKPAVLLERRVHGRPLTGREAFLELGAMIAQRYGKRLWVEKTPNHINCLPFIRQLFPEARIIHIVRDGRDVADSLSRVSFGSPNYFDNLLRWMREVEGADAFAASDRNTLAVRYEDLVADPGSTMREVCQFLGIGFVPAMLQPDGSERALIERDSDHMKEAATQVTGAKVRSWASRLSPGRQRMALMLAQRQLERFGYAEAARGGVEVVVSPRLLLSRHDRSALDRVLESLANARSDLRTAGVSELGTGQASAAPAIWLAAELPCCDQPGALAGGAPGMLLRGLVRMLLLRLRGTHIVFVDLPRRRASERWRLARLMRRLVGWMATLTVVVDAEAEPPSGRSPGGRSVPASAENLTEVLAAALS